MTVVKVINEEKAQTMQNTEMGGTESSVKETVAALKGIPTEEELIKTLKEQVLKVTFLKLDGELRVMTCTKNFDFIPEASRPKKLTDSKPGTVNVWDLRADAWRSFKYDRVQQVEPDDSNIREVG